MVIGMTVSDVQRLGSVFTWPDAQSAGMNHHQTALSAKRMMRGVYASDPTDLHMRIEGTLLIAGDKAAIGERPPIGGSGHPLTHGSRHAHLGTGPTQPTLALQK